jgi:hypothetical protein
VDVAWSASWKPSPFSETVVSATVDVPQGYTLRRTMILFSGFNSWLAGSTAAPDVSFTVPELPGASFDLGAAADRDGGTSWAMLPPVAPGTQGLHLALRPVPILSAPADGGTLDVGSPVTWTSDGEGAPFVEIAPNDNVSPAYLLFGGDGAATLPDLSALGVALPHAVSYQVVVFRNSTAATVDEIASQGAFFDPQTQPYTRAYSATHNVTTP